MDCLFGMYVTSQLCCACSFSIQILSCGYGLSFWPIPVVSAIGTMISADMGDPTGYIWFVPVCIKSVQRIEWKETNPIIGLDYFNHLCFLDLVCF